MSVQLFRIDDRLIHGQVVLGWAKYLNSKNVILCDNEIAGNDWESELYLSCVPAELTARILNVNDAVSALNNGAIELEKTIVLVKSPSVLLHMTDDGYIPDKVNLGGIHFGESRKKYLPYLFLSENEINDLRSCQRKGIKLYCQDVPNAKIYQLSDILKSS
jgi:mannose/fructose/N-acetylgalactosamine-specific phosphotransferase system component IIB